jgi:hypothetical protein
MAKGKTYYVDHVSADLPWSTKETPSNTRTKGAIKFKNCLLQIFDDNCAEIKTLTSTDLDRIKSTDLKLVRLMVSHSMVDEIHEFIKEQDLWHSPFKQFGGNCGTINCLFDIKDTDLTLIILKFNDRVWVVNPNHPYFKLYSDDRLREQTLDTDYFD